ncbi:MAG: PPOX class F420-dependent oxidoreductase [Candidatus Binatia bacterium]
MAFKAEEVAYMAEQRLGRLATVDAKGRPHVVPVTFRYNAELGTIDIGGHDFAKRKKWRDVQKTGVAAFVVDDVRPPWRPRFLEVRGRAETLPEGGADIGPGFDPEIIRIHPDRIVSWGLDEA